jgi:hypothetical protein
MLGLVAPIVVDLGPALCNGKPLLLSLPIVKTQSFGDGVVMLTMYG